MTPILGIYASQITGHLVTGSYESIATYTVGAGGQSTVTFSSIPQTYKHLQIRSLTRYDGSGLNESGYSMQFNGDTGNNYSYHLLYGYGTGTGAQGYGSQPNMWGISTIQGGALSNTFSAGIIDILDYTNTNKNKVIRGFGGEDTNGGTCLICLSSGSWVNTSAVTSITFKFGASNFVQYSQFALYGIK